MITSFRMYNAGPGAAAAWRALFGQVFAELSLDIEVIEHKWPMPIELLWSEAELCCAFMCGWPYARSAGMQAIAAPIPSPPRYEGLPRYCSEFLVREQSGWTRVQDAFGSRFGWMAHNSQSGLNAPRAHLAQLRGHPGESLFSQSVGPLGTPASALKALATSQVDVIAVDSFYLDLARHYQPEMLEGLRCIGTTEWTPIPPLVASAPIDAAIVERLSRRLVHLLDEPRYEALLQATLLKGFARVDRHAYSRLEQQAQEAIASGYADIR